MKFEELIEKTRNVKAPEFINENLDRNEKETPFFTFMDEIQKLDSRYRSQIRLQQYVLLSSSIVIAIFIFLISKIELFKQLNYKMIQLGLVLLLGGYIISFLMFQLKYKKYKDIDYNKDLIHFIEETKKRYVFFSQDRFLYIPLFIILDIGLYYTLSPILSISDLDEFTLIINLQFVLICIFSFDLLIKYRLWKKNQKPVFEEILNYVNQFEL